MLQLQPAFQYLILIIRRACDLNLVMISSLVFKLELNYIPFKNSVKFVCTNAYKMVTR